MREADSRIGDFVQKVRARYKTKKKAIEEGLRLLIQLSRQEKTRAFRGKLLWTGNLAEVRTDK